jgi:hypothetical protein
MLFLFHFSWQATFLILFSAPARARVISTCLGHILVEPGGTFLPHYHPVNILELIASGLAYEQIREEYDLKVVDILTTDADGAITFETQESGEAEPDMEGVKKLADVLGARHIPHRSRLYSQFEICSHRQEIVVFLKAWPIET